jgi:two-component system, sensor histidine kinase YesM
MYNCNKIGGGSMVKKFTITTKLMLFGTTLLTILTLLYTYSGRVSKGVIESQLKASSFNRFSFFMKQMEGHMDQLSINANTLSTDQSILQLGSKFYTSAPEADKMIVKNNIIDKLQRHAAFSSWTGHIIVYYPLSKQYAGTIPYTNNYTEDFEGNYIESWSYREKGEPDIKEPVFVRFFSVPYLKDRQFDNVNAIFQISFAVDNLRRMLNEFKAGEKGDPFLYNPGHEPITAYNPYMDKIRLLNNMLEEKELGSSGSITLFLGSRKYLVNYQKSNNLGWYLIDYMPIEEILAPINRSNKLFSITIASSFLLIILVWGMLYRKVQIPINTLVRSLQKIKERDFSVRIEKQLSNEFGILFTSFNEMADEIQELIGKVYTEKIRAQEAILKQLQAQINPHFLYNCLAYIMSMAKLKEYDSIIAMSYNLGKYFRYTTRLEKQTVDLNDEIELIKNYLEIQNLRMNRLIYEIVLPENMMKLQIPRLLLQPIVENAVVHGIETKKGMRRIKILCEDNKNEYTITVENDGNGLCESELIYLNESIRLPISDKTGFGTWNVYQRMLLFWEKGSDLSFSSVPEGGVRAVLRWGKNN